MSDNLQVNTNAEINIQNYKKCKRINKEGFGIIYLVEEKQTGDLYAAKVIDCGDDEDQCQKMIENVVEIMIRAKHPTIINFIGYSKLDFQEENNITFIMQFAANGSLAGVIKSIQNNDKPANYSNTSKQIIVVGITRGMKYLHDLNIIHRYLNAGNILLDEDFRPYISDFEFDHINGQFQYGKNIAYQAPELLKDQHYDNKVDVYAFGIILFELLTESFAYPELEKGKVSDFEFRNKVTNDNYRPKFQVNINEHLQQLIERCWSDDPNKRPTFSEIYDKLTGNDADKYFIEKVDIEKFKLYVEYISDETDSTEKYLSIQEKINQSKIDNDRFKTENIQHLKRIELFENEVQQFKDDNLKVKEKNDQSIKKIISIEEEIQELKYKLLKKTNKFDFELNRNLTVFDFNSLPLISQRLITENIIKTNEKMTQFFNKLKNLILYLNQLEQNCIEIKDNDEEYLIKDINEESRILLHYNAVDILYKSKLLDSKEFLNIVDQFTKVSLEIEYPSEFFQKVYDIVLKVKNLLPNKITISVFITDIEETDKKFKGDQNINYIKLDKCIRKIQSGSFEGCKSLIEILMPSTLTEIDECAFNGCTSLTQIIIPSSITEIKYYVFNGCSSLTQITIPSSVTSIGYYAFIGCSSLTQITIPSSVTNIEISAFSECISLKQIIFENPSSLSCISSVCFCRCKSLIEIEIPSSVKYISTFAFENCRSLTKITLNSSVKIDDSIFFGCYKLTEIDIKNNEDDEEDDDEVNFKWYDDNYLISKSDTDSDDFDVLVFVKKYLDEVTIPSFIKRIGSSSIQYCSLITSIVIPSSVTVIGCGAFEKCTSLKRIKIPSSVTKIESSAFNKCASLFEITFESPSEIKSLKRHTFRKCVSLTNISIPSSVKKIKDLVFCGCSSLKLILIPSSVTSIGESAFKGCSSLTKISIPSSVTKIENFAFRGCSSLEQISIPSSTSISSIAGIGIDSNALVNFI